MSLRKQRNYFFSRETFINQKNNSLVSSFEYIIAAIAGAVIRENTYIKKYKPLYPH